MKKLHIHKVETSRITVKYSEWGEAQSMKTTKLIYFYTLHPVPLLLILS